jgi:hypothetical protein
MIDDVNNGWNNHTDCSHRLRLTRGGHFRKSFKNIQYFLENIEIGIVEIQTIIAHSISYLFDGFSS